MELAELLIAYGLLDPVTAREVTESQGLYGGTFDTNLLELGQIDEKQLQPYLERAAGVRNKVNIFSEPSPEAVAVLRRDQAEAYRVVPFRKSGHTLDVVVNDATDLRTLDEVGFVTGCRLQINVATEMRVAFLLARAYNIQMPLRLQSLLSGIAWPKPEFSGLRAKRAQQAAADGQVAEETPQEISWPVGLARLDVSGVTEPAPMTPAAPATAAAGGTPDLAAVAAAAATAAARAAVAAVQSSQSVPVAMAAMTSAPVAPPPMAPPPAIHPAPPTVHAPKAGGTIPPKSDRAAVPVAVHPRTDSNRQSSYDLLASQLATTSEPEQIPPIALGYLGNLFSRIVIFTVRKAQLLGWDARGRRLRRDIVESLTFPLDVNSVFARVAQSGGVYEGPLPQDAVEESLMIKLGAETWPEHILVVPVRVKERSVALLYCEAVDREALARAHAPTIIVAEMMGESFVRFILARKSH